MLLDRLKAQGRSVARLPGKQSEQDYAATIEAMRAGVDCIHQASLRNIELLEPLLDHRFERFKLYLGGGPFDWLVIAEAGQVSLSNLLYVSRMARNIGGELRVEDGVLGPDDILITAPYKVQVKRLVRRLGQRARVGTVDKFQGREAPVAIHSLTASDGEPPRGLGFLLDPNRLNVAISRAQCLSIVVGSAALSTRISRSVVEVHQLCRLIEIGK